MMSHQILLISSISFRGVCLIQVYNFQDEWRQLTEANDVQVQLHQEGQGSEGAVGGQLLHRDQLLQVRQDSCHSSGREQTQTHGDL